MTPFENFLALTLIVFVRYILVAGGFYLLCYKWKKLSWVKKKLSSKEPQPQVIKEEFLWSAFTSLIFGAMGAWMFKLWEEGKTMVYIDFESYGVLYASFSLFLMLFVHDTYFYWTHRVLHHPWIFRTVHRTHHLSVHPSPWAAFCFHPLEALLQAFFLPLILFTIPSHPVTLFIFLMIMTVLGVINHLGYELYPKSFLQHKWSKTIISASNHSQHHLTNHCNFALYFTWWDLRMGTLKEPGVPCDSLPKHPWDTSVPPPALES